MRWLFDIKADGTDSIVIIFEGREYIDEVKIVEDIVDIDDHLLRFVLIGPFGNYSTSGIFVNGHIDLHSIYVP